jgi:hypothetical protein
MTTNKQETEGLDLATFTRFLTEIEEQPSWRAKADRESEYCDGNQLDSEVLRAQQAIGMPPAIEPLIGPTIDAVLGMEAKTRTDWRVIPDSDKAGDDVAEALNYKLNQAERHSKADRACSEAYGSQIKVGLGWVEVSRDSDPFKYPYRCKHVHRNEIWWDFLSTEPDLSDARYLIRRRWVDIKQAELMFPGKEELIRHSGSGWMGIDLGALTTDGGSSTDLAMSWGQERGWSVEEQQWRDQFSNRVCLFEVWYREWKRVLVLRLPDGRIVEYDKKNRNHLEAVAAGIPAQYAVVAKMRLSWWMGPHKLHDGPTPYRHSKFPYVAFWGKREDRTNVPFGLIRGMMYLQDNVNASTSKIRWGLSAVRTIRTEGAVVDDDERFRQEIARPDADIVLDAAHMAKAGATFKVERDFQLSEQQYKMLVDSREGIKRSGGIYDSFMGNKGGATSGLQTSMLVEQSTQSLADINDNFRFARMEVGDLLISLIIEDMIGKEETVTIDGRGIKEDKIVQLNVPTTDEDTGIKFLTNDVERTKLKVTLNDVPSTPSFRTQQLSAMSEAFKSMPPQFQPVVLPFLLSLMDVPNRDALIDAIKQATEQPTPEQIEQRIQEAIDQALAKAGVAETVAKVKLIEAQTRKVDAEATNKSVEGVFSATQAANQIATNPAIAPVADGLLKSAGFKDHDLAPIVPNVAPGVPAMDVPENTNPLTPTNPGIGMNAGIEGGAQQFAEEV